MALSNKEISALYFEALGSQHLREQDRKMVKRFAHAVESEFRKQDEALIRQMNEALDTAFHQTCSVGRPKDWEQIRNALHSARARLEGKP